MVLLLKASPESLAAGCFRKSPGSYLLVFNLCCERHVLIAVDIQLHAITIEEQPMLRSRLLLADVVDAPRQDRRVPVLFDA